MPWPVAASFAWLRHRPLDHAHLVIATDRPSGQDLAALIGHTSVDADVTHCLMLDSAGLAGDPAGISSARRMVSLMLLRLAGTDEIPLAIACRAGDRTLTRVLRDMTERLPGAVMHPAPGSQVINFSTAALAHRIGRRIDPKRVTDMVPLPVVLDMRQVDESILMDVARRIYRVGLPRTVVQPLPLHPRLTGST